MKSVSRLFVGVRVFWTTWEEVFALESLKVDEMRAKETLAVHLSVAVRETPRNGTWQELSAMEMDVPERMSQEFIQECLCISIGLIL